MKFQGLHAYRLKANADNPREVAFARQWNKEQAEGRILFHLIGKDLNERDEVVATTVIQWLGSNVGMSFLEEVILSEPKVKLWLQQRAFSKPTPPHFHSTSGGKNE